MAQPTTVGTSGFNTIKGNIYPIKNTNLYATLLKIKNCTGLLLEEVVKELDKKVTSTITLHDEIIHWRNRK